MQEVSDHLFQYHGPNKLKYIGYAIIRFKTKGTFLDSVATWTLETIVNISVFLYSVIIYLHQVYGIPYKNNQWEWQTYKRQC